MTTVFENLEFWTYDGKAAKEVDIVYGDSCNSLNDGLCGKEDHCSECAYSYPADEFMKWKSPWARCRCKDTEQY